MVGEGADRDMVVGEEADRDKVVGMNMKDDKQGGTLADILRVDYSGRGYGQMLRSSFHLELQDTLGIAARRVYRLDL